MDTINLFIKETDLTSLNAQTSNQAYGAISDTEYRVTSLFKGGSNPMAYAVTDGHIFIVPQAANTSRVNLFLQPTGLPHGAPVKYFVYRGLLKSDFLSSDGTAIRDSDSDDSDLVKNLRNAKNGAVALNLYSGLTDDYFIDNLFYNDDNQFAAVKQGDSIGRFDSTATAYGFEIMLDEYFFSPTMETAHLDVNVIDISSGDDDEDVLRCETLNYIDPAAYYGLFAHNAYSVGTNNDSSPTSVSKSDIYDFIQRFYTKNKVYVDIRDEYGHPLDWFADSPQTIKLTTDGTSALASTAVTYRDTNQFPIKTITSGFSNSAKSDNSQNYFTLELSLSTTNNTTPLLTLHTGYWLNSASCIQEDLSFSVCTNNSGWTDDKKFTIFTVDDSGTEIPITTYLRLQYGEYTDYDAITDQVTMVDDSIILNDIDDIDDDSSIDSTDFTTTAITETINNKGIFAFHVNGLSEYDESN
ncbi:MAG: hypothetical protein P4L28_11965 [Paludibacteraceae bacterium]|nr:hypothetical protein [Paludibacteraceae bacterium]